MLRTLVLLSTLTGLWSSEQLLGPLLRGELTIDARGDEWRAMIGGHAVPARRSNERIEFELPNGQGEFRGRIAGQKISGHWIQPRTAFPYLSRYTTPVELSPAGAKIWRGDVAPLEQRVSFYLNIEGDAAYLRNPEGNVFGRNQYTAELKDGVATLARVNHPQRLSGPYDEETERFSLLLLYNSAPISFKRVDPAPLGFLPRVPQAWSYRPPLAENDGWPTGTLSDAELDIKPIAALVQKILTASQSEHALNIHSLLIARHGKLVFEEYFYGFDGNRPHDMRSASKTFAPMLVGIAKVDPATPVASILPGFKSSTDERKNKVTVRDLMTMTSGLDCDDGDEQSRGNEDVMQNQEEESDWYRYTMALEMKRDPGGDRAIYCSAGINLLGAVVKQATGKWIPELFRDAVATPLQMRRYHLNLMPTSDAYLGGGMYIRPRDQLKLGQLYLNGGVWNGRRIISSAWVRDSLTRHAKFESAADPNHGYGYAWHTHDLSANGTIVQDWYAGGNGGQLIIILPSLSCPRSTWSSASPAATTAKAASFSSGRPTSCRSSSFPQLCRDSHVLHGIMKMPTDVTPHIFVLGPSGAGKSFVAAGVSQTHGYLHLELDDTSWMPGRTLPWLARRIRARLETYLSMHGAELEAVSFAALARPWRSFLSGDASPLSGELRRRSTNAAATACIVSFPSGMVLTAEQIAVADAAGITVRILYGSRDDCLRAFLTREAASNRKLDREHWLLHNGHTHETFGAPELAQYRVATFGSDGSRLPIERIMDAICG